MTQLYYHAASEQVTSGIRALLPHVTNPHCLDDAELLAHGIRRCVAALPQVEWWQRHGTRTFDVSAVPCVMSYSVELRPLEEVKRLAWDRVKSEREQRQIGPMPYAFPDGRTLHTALTEKARTDLVGSVTSALAMKAIAPTAEMPWTTDENGTLGLTPEQMIQFGLAVLSFYSAVHMQSQIMRVAINDAPSVADVVAAATWPEG